MDRVVSRLPLVNSRLPKVELGLPKVELGRAVFSVSGMLLAATNAAASEAWPAITSVYGSDH